MRRGEKKKNEEGDTEDITFRKGCLVQGNRVVFGENRIIGFEDQQVRIFVANLLNVTKNEAMDVQQPRCATSPQEQNWRV